MRICQLETIYRIFDSGDSSYVAWFGTADDIVEYLEEQKEHINGYNKDDGFVKNLERYGLTFQIIN